jgi:hypothetical protein
MTHISLDPHLRLFVVSLGCKSSALLRRLTKFMLLTTNDLCNLVIDRLNSIIDTDHSIVNSMRRFKNLSSGHACFLMRQRV